MQEQKVNNSNANNVIHTMAFFILNISNLFIFANLIITQMRTIVNMFAFYFFANA